MKNILLLVHDDDGQEARVQAALDLGRALDGHIDCIGVTYTPPLIGGRYDDLYLLGDALTQEHARERDNRARMTERLAREDVPHDWAEATGDIGPALRNRCDLSDVIVINRRLDDYSVPDMRDVAGDVIVSSGKPVLAVPEDCPRLDLSRPLIAWDGSRCAAAALRAAVPLLQKAGQVTILEVEDGSVATPAEEAAEYLSRYDVHAQVVRIAVAPGGAGQVIREELVRRGASYLVMGGFGHPRFVQSLFGGVTREMLGSSPVPVFLAH